MTNVLKMDDIDKQIIYIVQEQPYITHNQIASKVNRSQPNIGKRIKKLKEAGFLQLHAGLNIEATMDEMNFAIVALKTNNLDNIHAAVKHCPLILNAFSIFQRGYSQKRNIRGRGLGLSLVKSIVDSYKGKIWVEDRVDGDYTKGSNFIVLIPGVV